MRACMGVDMSRMCKIDFSSYSGLLFLANLNKKEFLVVLMLIAKSSYVIKINKVKNGKQCCSMSFLVTELHIACFESQ